MIQSDPNFALVTTLEVWKFEIQLENIFALMDNTQLDEILEEEFINRGHIGSPKHLFDGNLHTIYFYTKYIGRDKILIWWQNMVISGVIQCLQLHISFSTDLSKSNRTEVISSWNVYKGGNSTSLSHLSLDKITGGELRSGVKCIVLTIVTGSLWLVRRYRWGQVNLNTISTIPSH